MNNPKYPNRKSIRLKGYDYSQAGLYFITICTQYRKHLFGEIVGADPCVCPQTGADLRVYPQTGPQMILNGAGKMITRWYYELENKFIDIKCHEMVVMPNHIHFIIENTGLSTKTNDEIYVGADLGVCPNKTGEHNNKKTGEHNNKKTDEHNNNKTGEHNNKKTGEHNNKKTDEHNNKKTDEHVGSPLPTIVQWFKTMTTNEYIRGVKNGQYPRFEKRVWQRNYWEHIVRNENEYLRISQYIINNPAKWAQDKLNKKDGNLIEEPALIYGEEDWMI